MYALPEGLPAFTALLTASTLFVFGVSSSIVEMICGRLTSTSGLVLIFMPFWAALLGLVGLILGGVLRLVWTTVSYRHVAAERSRPWMARVFLAVQGIAVVSGASLAFYTEVRATPRVIQDLGKVKAVSVPTVDASDRRKADLLWLDDKTGTIAWGSNVTSVDVPRPSKQAALVRDASRGHVVRLSDPAIHSITRVEAVPLRSGDGDAYLIIGVVGREFEDRALVAVLAGNYEVVYRELIQRSGCFGEPILEAVRHDGRDMVVLEAPSCATKALTARP